MKTHSTRERLLASSMICGAALLSLSAPEAFAAAAASAAPAEVSEIVVTGTRIPTPNLTSVSPVTSVGAADIKAQGVTRVEDLINSLPQAFAAQGSNVSNGSDGTASVNLRGLGPNRTLVLIDGRRLQAGNPASAIGPVSADLNFIPTALVERVDILTGGASAVYGADAVAGVVNFIMKKDFEGVQIDAQYSFYQHGQQNPGNVQQALRNARASAAVPDNYIVPGDFRGGEGDQVTLLMGVNAPDGKGNVTAYATHTNINPVAAINYDYSACVLNSGTDFVSSGCTGSGTAYPARFGGFVVDVTNPAGNTFRPRNAARDVYNFAPTNYLQRPDQKYGMGAFAHYEINPHVVAYADLMFMDDNSTAQIAPGGVFVGGGPGPGGAYQVNCDNPLMSAQEAGLLCGANAGTPFIQNVTISRRNVEGGGRRSVFDHKEIRYVVGLRGEIVPDWTYDGYLQYGKTSLNTENDNFFITSHLNNALLATRNAQGQIVCQNGGADGCVPYNIFQIGGVTPAQLKYLQAPAFAGGNILEQIASFDVVGLLPEAIRSPLANDRLGVSFGAEYRREHLDYQSDLATASGQLNGLGAAQPPVNGGYDVYELFGEARIPLVQDKPFAKDITAELAYRYSNYSNAGGTNTYKISADWTVAGGLRLRGGFNRAVRAPNVVELFSPQNVVLDGTVDPCALAGSGKGLSDPLVVRCATLFHLTPDQVLQIEPDPAKQYNGQTGGNPNLKPEIADTYTVGMVWQPQFLPGANFTVDWFDIKVSDYIANVGANVLLTNCVSGANPEFCPLVHRDAIGSLRSSQGYVIDTVLNTGGLHTSGADVSATYRTGLDTFGIENMGSVQANFVGTYLDKLETTILTGGPAIDCAGLYGATCSTLGGSIFPNPKWRHKLRVAWNTPYAAGWFGDLTLSAQWRYFASVKVDATSSDPALNGPVPPTDAKFGARSYLDLLATFTVKQNYAFRVGVNNVLDRDPPITGQDNCAPVACNQNIYPQMYDALGRYVFMGLTANF